MAQQESEGSYKKKLHVYKQMKKKWEVNSNEYKLETRKYRKLVRKAKQHK